MQFLKESIQRKLDELPEPALQEVLDFVEFLSWKMVPREEPVLVVAGILSGSPLSAEEIERELYGDTEGTP
jgi:hypothetical protein